MLRRVLVFLAHGMGRTTSSLGLLGRRLRANGHTTSHFGYRVRSAALAEIAESFVAHVTREVQRVPGRVPHYAIVSHSLGGIITRLASPRLPPGFCRLVMLAPPNRSPVLARTFRDNALFRALTRDAGARLADPAFYETLPVPNVPTLVFAGTGGPTAKFLPFRGSASDGVVAVGETMLKGAAHRLVPSLHTFIMNDWGVTREILLFLRETHE